MELVSVTVCEAGREPPAVCVKLMVVGEAVTLIPVPVPPEPTINVAVIGIDAVDAPVKFSAIEQVYVFCAKDVALEFALTVIVPVAGPLSGDSCTQLQFWVLGIAAV